MKNCPCVMALALCLILTVSFQTSYSQNAATYWIANGNSTGATQPTLSLGNLSSPTSAPSFTFSTSDNGTSFLNIYANRWGSSVSFTRADPSGNQYNVMSLYGTNGTGGQLSLYNTSNQTGLLLNSQGNTWLNGGNVGIGTTNPQTVLEVTGANLSTSTGTSEIARFDANVGNYSQIRFLLNRFTAGNGWTTASTRIQAWTDVTGQGYIDFNPNGSLYGLAFGTGSTELMRITQGGNVLIGKTSQANTGYLLDVNGSARANGVVVNTTGADFVFDPTYRLTPLKELETYVQREHHLPGIASASQMQQQGLDLGDNQTKLLAKVEELTLYLIQQKKENEANEEKIRTLEERLDRLEKASR